jgi:hypothetical protein
MLRTSGIWYAISYILVSVLENTVATVSRLGTLNTEMEEIGFVGKYGDHVLDYY